MQAHYCASWAPVINTRHFQTRRSFMSSSVAVLRCVFASSSGTLLIFTDAIFPQVLGFVFPVLFLLIKTYLTWPLLCYLPLIVIRFEYNRPNLLPCSFLEKGRFIYFLLNYDTHTCLTIWMVMLRYDTVLLLLSLLNDTFRQWLKSSEQNTMSLPLTS